MARSVITATEYNSAISVNINNCTYLLFIYILNVYHNGKLYIVTKRGRPATGKTKPIPFRPTKENREWIDSMKERGWKSYSKILNWLCERERKK